MQTLHLPLAFGTTTGLNLADEAGEKELVDFSSDDVLALRSQPARLLLHWPRIGPHGQAVLDHLPWDPGHIRLFPGEHIDVSPEEGDEREFLFGI